MKNIMLEILDMAAHIYTVYNCFRMGTQCVMPVAYITSCTRFRFLLSLFRVFKFVRSN